MKGEWALRSRFGGYGRKLEGLGSELSLTLTAPELWHSGKFRAQDDGAGSAEVWGWPEAAEAYGGSEGSGLRLPPHSPEDRGLSCSGQISAKRVS